MRIHCQGVIGAAVAAAFAAGCIPPFVHPLDPGSRIEQISVDGAQREYVLHLPVGVYGGRAGPDASRPMPLVIILHGFSGNGPQMEQETAFSSLADSVGFVVVYGNGEKGASKKRRWVAETGPQDIHYVATVIDTLRRRMPIDSTRIYVAGFSNGANMTYRLGAELGSRIAAIGVVSGTIARRLADGSIPASHIPTVPVPAIVFHGMKDPTVPFRGDPPDSGKQVSAPESVSLWAAADHCASTPAVDTLPRGNVIRESFRSCAPGTDVVFYQLVEGKHHWNNATTKHAELPTTDIVWQFFVAHPLSGRGPT
jgi:polyhydroxybutyrate depolymerase